jgi:hypothetical protein
VDRQLDLGPGRYRVSAVGVAVSRRAAALSSLAAGGLGGCCLWWRGDPAHGRHPDLIADPRLANPFGVGGSAGEQLRHLVGSGVPGFIPPAVVLASASSLLLWFRRARGVERQQLKWFADAVALSLATWVMGFLRISERTGILLLVSLWTIPLGIGVAILRYRLYDIDRLINRTLV